jgi:hypothetical protein
MADLATTFPSQKKKFSVYLNLTNLIIAAKACRARAGHPTARLVIVEFCYRGW